ncbi:unnamed protein product, partial [Closterium sp. NIES-54]
PTLLRLSFSPQPSPLHHFPPFPTPQQSPLSPHSFSHPTPPSPLHPHPPLPSL